MHYNTEIPFPLLQESGSGDELSEESNDLLNWVSEIEEGSQEMREAFVRCCLYRHVPAAAGELPYSSENNAAVEVFRGQLVFVCQRLRLPKLLECSTTDHS